MHDPQETTDKPSNLDVQNDEPAHSDANPESTADADAIHAYLKAAAIVLVESVTIALLFTRHIGLL